MHHTSGHASTQEATGRQADQHHQQTQHQQPAPPAWPQSRKASPTEQDKQSAEALKKEGNAYFGKAKYGAAIEVLAQLHAHLHHDPTSLSVASPEMPVSVHAEVHRGSHFVP